MGRLQRRRDDDRACVGARGLHAGERMPPRRHSWLCRPAGTWPSLSTTQVEPTVAITGGSLVSGGWRRGNQTSRSTREMPVGHLQRERARRRNVVSSAETTRATTRFQLPCPSGPDSAPIETAPLHDGSHDAADRGARRRGQPPGRRAHVLDRQHAAGAAETAHGEGGPGGDRATRSRSRWTQPASGIARADRAARIADLSGRAACADHGCPMATVDARKGTADGLRVPRAGEWRARLWLEDAAGQCASANGADVILRFDDQPPSLSLASPSTDQPARRPRGRDRRRLGRSGRARSCCGARARRTGSACPSSHERTDSPRAINDEAAPEGRLRAARARRSTAPATSGRPSAGPTGRLAELALPLRIMTRLAVGKPKRVRARGAGGKRRYRIKLIRSPRAGFGRTIPIRGRLTSPGGNPLAGRDVQVFEQTKLAGVALAPDRDTHRRAGTAGSSSRRCAGPSRTLALPLPRERHGPGPHGATCGSASAPRRRSTRAARSVVNGEDVTFRGRLRGRRSRATGKLIELQARARGRWLTFRTVRANARTGRWRYTYRFSGDARERALPVPRPGPQGGGLPLRDGSLATCQSHGSGTVSATSARLAVSAR